MVALLQKIPSQRAYKECFKQKDRNVNFFSDLSELPAMLITLKNFQCRLRPESI